MHAQEYWNEIGVKKDFEDPLYWEKLSPYLTPESRILEYGCGYGRLIQILHTNGFQNILGVDFSQNMIARGKKLYPHLDMHFLGNGHIPCPKESVDVIIMSTVLCCIVDDSKQKELMQTLSGFLKKRGVLYLSDLLLSDHSRYVERYALGLKQFGLNGVYTTNENLVVRHLSTAAVLKLLEPFDIKWFEQFDFKTMNQNPARTFHCVAQKNAKLMDQ